MTINKEIAENMSEARFIMRELYAHYNNKLKTPLSKEETVKCNRKLIEIMNDEDRLTEEKVMKRVMTSWKDELMTISGQKEKNNG